MIVSRISTLTGKTQEMDLDITLNQLQRFVDGKEYIQDIFPNLTASEREFILTGITPEEWDECFKEIE